MFLLHGTTATAARSIIKDGFQAADTVWTCSNPYHTYMVEVGSTYNEEDALRFAYESALTTAAKLDMRDTDIVIFGFDFPSDIADEYLMPDISSPNMDGCWCVENNTLNQLIRDNKISCSVKIIQNAYIPYLRPFYLTHASRNYMDLDKNLTCVCDELMHIDFYNIYSMMWSIDADSFNELNDFDEEDLLWTWKKI